MGFFTPTQGRPSKRWTPIDKVLDPADVATFDEPIGPRGLVKLAFLGLAPVFLILWPLQINMDWVFRLVSTTYVPPPAIVTSLEIAAKTAILGSVLYAAFLAYLAWWDESSPIRKAGLLLFWTGAAYLVTAMNLGVATLMETTIFQEEPLIAAEPQLVTMVALIPLGGVGLALLFTIAGNVIAELRIGRRRAASRAALAVISKHTPSSVAKRKRAA